MVRSTMRAAGMLLGAAAVWASAACSGGEGAAQAGTGGGGGSPLVYEVAVEGCVGEPGKPTYATHAYPGRTADELAPVVAVGMLVDTYDQPPDGYPAQQANAFVRDGAVSVRCTIRVDPVPARPYYSSVRFYLPR